MNSISVFIYASAATAGRGDVGRVVNRVCRVGVVINRNATHHTRLRRLRRGHIDTRHGALTESCLGEGRRLNPVCQNPGIGVVGAVGVLVVEHNIAHVGQSVVAAHVGLVNQHSRDGVAAGVGDWRRQEGVGGVLKATNS